MHRPESIAINVEESGANNRADTFSNEGVKQSDPERCSAQNCLRDRNVHQPDTIVCSGPNEQHIGSKAVQVKGCPEVVGSSPCFISNVREVARPKTIAIAADANSSCQSTQVLSNQLKQNGSNIESQSRTEGRSKHKIVSGRLLPVPGKFTRHLLPSSDHLKQPWLSSWTTSCRPNKNLPNKQFEAIIGTNPKLQVTISASNSSRSELPFNGIKDDLHMRDIDSGYAWIILAVVFVINASTFGSARAYGLIFDRMSDGDDPDRFKNAALPFTVMGAVENMSGPLTGYLLSLTGSWRLLVFIGSLLITGAHLLAALNGSLVGQLLTMGLMCGLGLSFVTMSFFQVNNAYFVRYRSTAFGIGLAGAAIGAFYITPVCKYFLDHQSISSCYLVLSLLLFPNVPLALLLKPKPQDGCSGKSMAAGPGDLNSALVVGQVIGVANSGKHRKRSSLSSLIERIHSSFTGTFDKRRLVQRSKTVNTISNLVEAAAPTIQQSPKSSVSVASNRSSDQEIWHSARQVLMNPLFHLIWPTQVMFCWLNFVFGIIVVNFGRDRGLTDSMASELVPIWALGQLVGRMIMGTLVDMNFISYRLFTMTCFGVIGSTTWTLNVAKLTNERHNFMLISMLIFLLSVFISNLYILFNGLVVKYMDKSVQALSIGISSFIGSFLLLPRANIIGHYRESVGNYDGLLDLLTYASLLGALSWLILPQVFKRLNFGKSKS